MKIFISACETSADLYAAELVKVFKAKKDPVSFLGLGSSKMQEAGVEILADVSLKSSIGFIEPLINIPYFLKLFFKLKKIFKSQKIDLLIAIDCQGFNVPLLKLAKKHKIKTVYFIPPQEWIWGTKKGTKDIVESSDLILAIFEKELKYYTKNNAKVKFIGHPLFQILTDFKQKLVKKNDNNKNICLLPGSRIQEIKTLLPFMLDLISEFEQNQYFVVSANKQLNPLIKKILKKSNLKIEIIDNKQRYQVMHNSDLILGSSGTLTLEALFFEKPMIVLYKLSALTFFIAKYILKIKIKFMALPNLLLDKMIMPEFLLNITKAEEIKTKFKAMLVDDKIDSNYIKLKQLLMPKTNPFVQARKIIIDLIAKDFKK